VIKFLNRKGEDVDFGLGENTNFEGTILAQSGGGQAFVSTSLKDLENLPQEAGKAILSNTNDKTILQ
jgi:hypothetical protein